jgi:hypothetical protein
MQQPVVPHVLKHFDRDDSIKLPVGLEVIHVVCQNFQVGANSSLRCLTQNVLSLGIRVRHRRDVLRADNALPSIASTSPNRSPIPESADHPEARLASRSPPAPAFRPDQDWPYLLPNSSPNTCDVCQASAPNNLAGTSLMLFIGFFRQQSNRS